MLEEIFTTQGRLNRLPYLKYFFGLLFASAFLNFMVSFVVVFLTGDPESTLLYILSLIVTVPFTVGSIMCAIRRLHDLDRSGWLFLLALIPILNLFLEIYLFCFRGTRGVNKYGADPLEV